VLEALRKALSGLPAREAQIVMLRFGLADDGVPRTYDEIGRQYGVTRERIVQIEAKALSKVRHPSRSRALRDFLDDVGGMPDWVREMVVGVGWAAEQPLLVDCMIHGRRRFAPGLRDFCSSCPCPRPNSTGGRPPAYCSDECRKAADLERRKAKRRRQSG
jgi:hypothetical protein